MPSLPSLTRTYVCENCANETVVMARALTPEADVVEWPVPHCNSRVCVGSYAMSIKSAE